MDLLREAMSVLAQAVTETEISGQIGAAPYERSSERVAYRNGCRTRRWDARSGTIELKIPQGLRQCLLPLAAGAAPSEAASAASVLGGMGLGCRLLTLDGWTLLDNDTHVSSPSCRARLAIAALVIVATGCSTALQEGPAGEWKVYEPTDGSFSVMHPANFEAYPLEDVIADVPDAQSTVGVLFANTAPSLGTNLLTGVMQSQWAGTELRLGVVLLPGGGYEGKAEHFAGLFRDSYAGSAGYREIAFRPTTIAGLEGFDYTFVSVGVTEGGVEVQQTMRVVFLSGDDTLYMINAGARSSTFETEVATVDRFIFSFSAPI